MHATSQTLVCILVGGICLSRGKILLRIYSICHALLLRLSHHLRPNILLVVVIACWNLLVDHGAVGWDVDGRRVILKHARDIEMVLVQAHIDIKDQRLEGPEDHDDDHEYHDDDVSF